MDFKYKTTFEYDISAHCSIKDIKDDLKVSNASLDQLKGLIPEDIDLNTNVDLMGVAFVIVAGYAVYLKYKRPK